MSKLRRDRRSWKPRVVVDRVPAIIRTLLITQITLGSIHVVAQKTEYRIVVDPDVRVSYEGNDVAHEESPIAAANDDPNNLYAGAWVEPQRLAQSGQEFRIYYSKDAGSNWESAVIYSPHVDGWDHAIVGGKGGRAYFAQSSAVYRTLDGGVSWQVMSLAQGAGWDREFLGLDNSDGRFSGRLYFAGEHDHAVYVSSSDEKTATFSAPILACKRNSNTDNVMALPNPSVLGDGTLIIGCMHYPVNMEVGMRMTEGFGIARSTDGGRTFSAYKEIAQQKRVRRDPSLNVFRRAGSFPVIAVGSPRTVYANDLYAVWTSLNGPLSEGPFFSSSDDLGQTWSPPKAIPGCSRGELTRKQPMQAEPMLAVNNEGIIGIAWFGDCDAIGNKGYDIYFTASSDGGQSWLPAVRVSSVSSYPESPQNLAPNVTNEKTGEILLASPYVDVSLGGDYHSMAVDAAGRFHPLWNDARKGAFQLYTSSIHVVSRTSVNEMMAANLEMRPESSAQTCSFKDRVKLLLDDSRWNASTRSATLFIRLENVSHSTLTGTLKVQVEVVPANSALRDIVNQGPQAEQFRNTTIVRYEIPIERPLFPFSVTQEEPLRLKSSGEMLLRYEILGTCSVNRQRELRQ